MFNAVVSLMIRTQVFTGNMSNINAENQKTKINFVHFGSLLRCLIKASRDDNVTFKHKQGLLYPRQYLIN